MSKESGDALRIPIEIKTEDLQELQSIIQDITEAQTAVREIKPSRGKRSDSSSRSAISPLSSDAFGIFSNVREGETLPAKTRDKTSRQAFQRESEFAKMREELQDVKNQQQTLNEGLGLLTQASGFGSLLSGSKFSKLKTVGTLATKAFLPIAAITTITSLVEDLMDKWVAPGGILDRRFRRNVREESLKLTNLSEKAEISAGRRVIRVTTISGLRGDDAQVRSNLDYVKSGVRIYDFNGVLSKNVGVGTI